MTDSNRHKSEVDTKFRFFELSVTHVNAPGGAVNQASADAKNAKNDSRLAHYARLKHKRGSVAIEPAATAPEESNATSEADIAKRIAVLEMNMARHVSGVGTDVMLGRLSTQEKVDAAERVARSCRERGIFSAVIREAPGDYYSWGLEKRAHFLGGCLTAQLCKSIVVENKMFREGKSADPAYSRFYCVIVQYVARLNAEGIAKHLRAVVDGGALSKKSFNFQLAPSEASAELTGYNHNAVTPFAWKTDIPVILSDQIAKSSFSKIWLGAGHMDLKLSLSIKEFLLSFAPIVAKATHD